MLLTVPPVGSVPVVCTETNLPSISIAEVAPETMSTAIQVPSSQLTKLSQWWGLHREGITASVIKVFGVTSKVLELVPLAEPAAKAFEHAASILEDVQVLVILGER
jgi:hypothetical protein